MSITNLIYKIKGQISIDKLTILYLFIIIGVGISSFGLGRLSVDNQEMDSKMIITENQILSENKSIESVGFSGGETSVVKEKRYVASKNGKMYYSLNCSGAKRIKEENKIWFSTSEEAEKSGYTFSLTCK